MTNYEILGIPETATIDEIKAAYRANVKKYHPDVNDAPNAAAMFRLVEQAYQELTQARRSPPPAWEAPPEQEAPPPAWENAPPPPSYQEAPPFSEGQRPPNGPAYTAPRPETARQPQRAATSRIVLRVLFYFLSAVSLILRITSPFVVRFGKYFQRIVLILALIVSAVSLVTNVWASGTPFRTLLPFGVLFSFFLALELAGRFLTGWLDAQLQKLDYCTR